MSWAASISIIVTASIILCGFMGYAWSRYSSLVHDVSQLKELLRSNIRRERPRAGLRLSHPLTQSFWHSLSSVIVASRSGDSSGSTLRDLISASTRIAGAADEVRDAAREVIAVVMEQTRPEVQAGAVVLRDPVTGKLRLEHVSGLPTTRVEDALLMQFEQLFDLEQRIIVGSDLTTQSTDRESGWGYQLPQRGTLFDFSAFGVGLTYTAPLRTSNSKGESQSPCGALWLGFRTGATSLTPESRKFVEAVTQHAAASFLTAQKMRERTEQSDQEKKMLLGISHDLRAPGNSALYAVRDLLSGEIDSLTTEQYLRLSLIEKSLEDQLDILADVLDFTKHQRGFLNAAPQRLQLGSFMTPLIERFSAEAASRGLLFECNPVPACETYMDPHHLRRMITNFLTNAIKYTDRGCITVTFLRIGERLEVRISDTGIGVPEQEREQLFQEYTRLGNSTGRQGIGLGLALTRALASLNHCSVLYHPNEGGGSTFGVSIPVISVAQIASSIPIKLNSILVVDDDAAACRTSMRYLRGFADTLIPAGTCAEAISLATDLKPNLIVTDLNLGDNSCETLLDELSSKQLEIPTLILTGSSDNVQLERLRSEYGANVLEKPFDRGGLVTAITGLLKKGSDTFTGYP